MITYELRRYATQEDGQLLEEVLHIRQLDGTPTPDSSLGQFTDSGFEWQLTTSIMPLADYSTLAGRHPHLLPLTPGVQLVSFEEFTRLNDEKRASLQVLIDTMKTKADHVVAAKTQKVNEAIAKLITLGLTKEQAEALAGV